MCGSIQQFYVSSWQIHIQVAVKLVVFVGLLLVCVGVSVESFTCSWDPFTPTGFQHPALMWELVPGLICILLYVFCWNHWEACTFLQGAVGVESGSGGERRRERTGKSGGRRSCSWGCIVWKDLERKKRASSCWGPSITVTSPKSTGFYFASAISVLICINVIF